MNLVEKAKLHGAILGLEAELNTRITTLRNAYDKRNWVLVHSSSVHIGDLSEELRKLTNDLEPKPQDPSAPKAG